MKMPLLLHQKAPIVLAYCSHVGQLLHSWRVQFFSRGAGYTLMATILFISCNEKLLEKPDNLIERDKMVELLKELAVVNAAKTTNISVLRENNIEPMAYVFNKYDIDSIQFVESDKYYASFPIEYEKIYKEVEAALEKEQTALKEAKAIKDSLRLLETEKKQEMAREKKQKITDSLAKTAQSKN